MGRTVEPQTTGETLTPAVPVRRTGLAVVLAWIVPGLGHLLLGRWRRGLLFGLLIWGSFGLGLAHDGRLALRDPRQPILSSLQVVANLGVGPADLVARWFVYRGAAYSFSAAPSPRPANSVEETVRKRASSGVSIYGTAYLWTAGLMNLLLLFDVWDIGLGRKL
jgi:hypothetical protein